MDREVFFDGVRTTPFGGVLRQEQVDGISAILDEWERRSLSDLRWLAYMLATVFHETARTMQPIREYGSAGYFTSMYDIEGERPQVARSLGNLEPGDGARFCGRGYVQLTGRANYQRMAQVTGHDLVTHPDLALLPPVASAVLFEGMVGGLFTGVCLADCFGAEADWRGARRIVNGTDRAGTIAGHAVAFHTALEAASRDVALEATGERPGFWAWLLVFIRAVVTGGRA